MTAERYDPDTEEYEAVDDREVEDAAWWACGYALPDGWAVAGTGSHRALLRTASGRYLKVATGGDNTPSYREVVNWAKLTEAGWSVPEHTLYRGRGIYGAVVAVTEVEYVEADGSRGDVVGAQMALADLRSVDLNHGNVVVRRGEPVIVDAGGVA